MTPLVAPTPYVVRRINSVDADRLARFYDALSPDSRDARFHGGIATIPDRTARFFCGPDHLHREGIVAEAMDADGRMTIIRLQ